jgi:shikimate dehydrogenase
MSVHAKLPLAGVLGAPVGHSRSPRLHGHWLKVHGLAGHYVPLHVAPEDLREVLEALPKAGFVGVNVTIPHKQAVLPLAAQVSEAARRIGAANTLTFLPAGGFHADNTDAAGFMANLRAGAPGWVARDGRALVLGAGGAARAVVVALLDAGVPGIILANRSRDRAEELAEQMGPALTVIDWNARKDAVSDAGLIVNTTSLGMSGQPPLEISLDGLRNGTVVTDLVYTPLETPLLTVARNAGATVVDGLGMLIYQGVPGFHKWFGLRPEVDAATRAAVLA